MILTDEQLIIRGNIKKGMKKYFEELHKPSLRTVLYDPSGYWEQFYFSLPELELVEIFKELTEEYHGQTI